MAAHEIINVRDILKARVGEQRVHTVGNGWRLSSRIVCAENIRVLAAAAAGAIRGAGVRLRAVGGANAANNFEPTMCTQLALDMYWMPAKEAMLC